MSQILITTDAIGGVWTYSLALAAGLAEAGAHCTLAVLGPAPAAPPPHATLVQTGLPLDWLAPDAATLRHTAQSLAHLAARLGATTVHLHAPGLAAAAWPAPVIATVHSCMATWWDGVRGGPRPDVFAWQGAATLEGLERAAYVVAPSQAFAADLRRTYGLSRRIEIIHNGLPPTPASNMDRRQDFILTAGRLWDGGKNMALLDHAAAAVAAPIRAAGPLTSPDGATFVPRAIEPLGNLPAAALRALMARAAIFAAPSLYEPFGLCVLEAAQTGAPLVLSDIATFRELWDGAALFVSPRDAGAWARTLNQLLADPEALARLGQAAQTRAGAYTQAAMVRATAALHRRAATTRQAA